MEQNIVELLESIKKEKEFFEQEKEIFAQNFLKEMSLQKEKNGSKLLPSSAVLTIIEKLYIILFLSSKDPLKELYNFAYKVAKSKIDLKEVLIKSTLRLVKDFIDHILKKSSDYEIIKNLITLIDLYLIEVDRAYSKYYSEIEDELNKIKHKIDKDEEDLIVALLTKVLKEDKKVELLDFYKEVPVVCKSRLMRIKDKKAYIDIKNCKFNIFKEDKSIYLKIPSFPKVIKVKIDIFNIFDYIRVKEFEFSEVPQEKRKFVRVQPKKPISVDIVKDAEEIKGVINDISIGGVGVYVEDVDRFEKGDKIFLNFELNQKILKVEGVIRYIIKDLRKMGVEFILTHEIESEIAEYVLERQFEIIKEVRI